MKKVIVLLVLAIQLFTATSVNAMSFILAGSHNANKQYKKTHQSQLHKLVLFQEVEQADEESDHDQYARFTTVPFLAQLQSLGFSYTELSASKPRAFCHNLFLEQQSICKLYCTYLI